MSDIKAIKGLDGTIYNIKDNYSEWGGTNLLKNIPRKYVATDYDAYLLNLTENLVVGQTYTLQLWDVNVYHSAKTAADTGVCFYWGGGLNSLGNWYGTRYFTAGTNNYHADHLVKTFTITWSEASNSGAKNPWLVLYNSVGYLDGTRNMSVGKWKLEKGHKATDWTPCYGDIFSVSGEQLNVNL
jgi:hypothetical protein